MPEIRFPHPMAPLERSRKCEEVIETHIGEIEAVVAASHDDTVRNLGKQLVAEMKSLVINYVTGEGDVDPEAEGIVRLDSRLDLVTGGINRRHNALRAVCNGDASALPNFLHEKWWNGLERDKVADANGLSQAKALEKEVNEAVAAITRACPEKTEEANRKALLILEQIEESASPEDGSISAAVVSQIKSAIGRLNKLNVKKKKGGPRGGPRTDDDQDRFAGYRFNEE